MLKKFLLVVMFACSSILVHAQQFNVGDNVGSLGIGFGSSLAHRFGSSGPGIALQLEHGMWDVEGPGTISLGGYLGYNSFSSRYGIPGSIYSYKVRSSYMILGVRSAYHYHGLDIKELDLYGGLMLSLNIYSESRTSDFNGNYVYVGPDAGTSLSPSLYVGARYYFTENLAAYGELGYGISFFTVGAAYHF